MQARADIRGAQAEILLAGPDELTGRCAAVLSDSGMRAACFASVSEMHGAERRSPEAILLCAAALEGGQLKELRSLLTGFPECPVIVLAARVERWELKALLAAGAAGVLLADRTLAARLPLCVRAARSGQVCVPHSLGRDLAPAALSAREKQVLGLVVMGYMNCEIAERLFLAQSTVKSHLSSAFGKLGVRSRNEAARLILDPEHGLGTGILALSAACPAADAAETPQSPGALTVA